MSQDLAIERASVAAKSFHGHTHAGPMNLFVVTDTFEELTQSCRSVRYIEFFKRLAAAAHSYRYAVLRATNIQRDVKFNAHETVSQSVKITRQNRLRALPIQELLSLASSHQALQTLRMTRAAFQAEPILSNRAGPLSHTLVTEYANPGQCACHSTNPRVGPF